MDVFVIPIGRDRYELYCEVNDDTPVPDEVQGEGLFGRAQRRAVDMLRAVEAQHREGSRMDVTSQGRIWRLRHRVLGWMAERIAEQRLLWNLRRETDAVADRREIRAQDVGRQPRAFDHGVEREVPGIGNR